MNKHLLEKFEQEKRDHGDIMYCYRQAIKSIIKKGKKPTTAFDRMTELKIRRMRKLKFQKEMLKAIKNTNGIK